VYAAIERVFVHVHKTLESSRQKDRPQAYKLGMISGCRVGLQKTFENIKLNCRKQPQAHPQEPNFLNQFSISLCSLKPQYAQKEYVNFGQFTTAYASI
jgi:hypothetical protein